MLTLNKLCINMFCCGLNKPQQISDALFDTALDTIRGDFIRRRENMGVWNAIQPHVK